MRIKPMIGTNSLIGQALFSIVIVYDNHEVLFLTKANKYKKSIIYLAEGG
jgi:hypothetical protein